MKIPGHISAEINKLAQNLTEPFGKARPLSTRVGRHRPKLFYRIYVIIGLLFFWGAPAPSLAATRTPVFLHFFDWFHLKEWQEKNFVDPLDWCAIGVTGTDRSSEQFYYKQFAYMKRLGVAAVAWV